MALADYRLCDVCENKVFYDANLNYDWNNETGEISLERLGDWKVICEDCARTHKVVIVDRDSEDGSCEHCGSKIYFAQRLWERCGTGWIRGREVGLISCFYTHEVEIFDADQEPFYWGA